MPFSNADAVAVFDEIADLLEVQGGNAFRVRAYRNAARTLGDIGPNLKDMLEAGEKLEDLPGIGKDLAHKIEEIIATGSCALLDDLHKQVPPGVTALLKLPGMGPRRVQMLHEALGVKTLDDVRAAAEQHRICELRGFSEATERHILDAVLARLQSGQRFPLAQAAETAEALQQHLKQVRGVKQVVAAGSLRRMRDTVGDLDLLVTTTPACTVMDHFVAHPDVQQVLAKGQTRASVVLRNGLQVDLRAVPPASFGAAWMYFTGSKAHNIALRKIAQDADLKLNEYGLYRGTRRIAGETEEAVYRALGLPWIEPELREDRGEIQAAHEDRLPRLVRPEDVRGDLHVHTSASDGRDTLQAMVQAARDRGLSYVAITDHSPRMSAARGLDAERLARQMDVIDALNAKLDGITVLKGVEVDILEDGQLDLHDSVLQRLDLVVGAIHQHFDLPRERQTERLLRAMDHPHFSVLAHPSNRLIGKRLPIDIDLPRIVRHAKERGCFLELNAQMLRLDMDDHACRMAKQEGVLVSVSTDAHRAEDLQALRWGVGQARRGWLAAHDVLNTRSLEELRALLDATMGRPAKAMNDPTAPAKQKRPRASSKAPHHA